MSIAVALPAVTEVADVLYTPPPPIPAPKAVAVELLA